MQRSLTGLAIAFFAIAAVHAADGPTGPETTSPPGADQMQSTQRADVPSRGPGPRNRRSRSGPSTRISSRRGSATSPDGTRTIWRTHGRRFARAATRLPGRPAWAGPCARSTAVNARDAVVIRRFLEREFTLYEIRNTDRSACRRDHRVLRAAAERQPRVRAEVSVSRLRHAGGSVVPGFAQPSSCRQRRTGGRPHRRSQGHRPVRRAAGRRSVCRAVPARSRRRQAGHPGQADPRADRGRPRRSVLHARGDRARSAVDGRSHPVGRRRRRPVFDAGPGLRQGPDARRADRATRLRGAERPSVHSARPADAAQGVAGQARRPDARHRDSARQREAATRPTQRSGRGQRVGGTDRARTATDRRIGKRGDASAGQEWRRRNLSPEVARMVELLLMGTGPAGPQHVPDAGRPPPPVAKAPPQRTLPPRTASGRTRSRRP